MPRCRTTKTFFLTFNPSSSLCMISITSGADKKAARVSEGFRRSRDERSLSGVTRHTRAMWVERIERFTWNRISTSFEVLDIFFSSLQFSLHPPRRRRLSIHSIVAFSFVALSRRRRRRRRKKSLKMKLNINFFTPRQLRAATTRVKFQGINGFKDNNNKRTNKTKCVFSLLFRRTNSSTLS